MSDLVMFDDSFDTPTRHRSLPSVIGPNATEEEIRLAYRQAIDANRDKWGRPKVMLPDGSKEVGYRRASSYGAPLEDESQLTKWKMRQVARGIARRNALALAVTRAEMGLDGPYEAAKKAKTELNDLCQQAMTVVESGDKASIGTSLHDVCERIDRGEDPGHIPAEWRPDVEAYRELAQAFRMLSIERFVVQDDHQVAGTTDRVAEVRWPLLARSERVPKGEIITPGSVLIVDQKTSQDMNFAGAKFGVQCWAYATGVPYDPINKVRIPWGHEPPRIDWAAIIHTPSGGGKAKLHWVDLVFAAQAAEDARRNYGWRNKWGKQLICEGDASPYVLTYADRLRLAESVEELHAIFFEASNEGKWTPELTEIAMKCRLALSRRVA